MNSVILEVTPSLTKEHDTASPRTSPLGSNGPKTRNALLFLHPVLSADFRRIHGAWRLTEWTRESTTSPSNCMESFFNAHAPIYEVNCSPGTRSGSRLFLMNCTSTRRSVWGGWTLGAARPPPPWHWRNGAEMLRRYRNEDLAEGRFDPSPWLIGRVPTREGLPAVPARVRGLVHDGASPALPCGHGGALHVGRTAGNWGRRPLDLEEIELLSWTQGCRTIGLNTFDSIASAGRRQTNSLRMLRTEVT